MTEVTADLLLNAYASGVFPMAEDRFDPTLYWYDPEFRGVLPLEAFHCPKRLARTVRSEPYRVTIDTCFSDVMRSCAAPARGRRTTWINDTIIELYTELHERDFAHSVEVWQEDRLVGGLYGVSLGKAFFGESMFSRESDASKIALVYLVARLKFGGYTLLDTQFITDHLRQFGAEEIPRADYKKSLEEAVYSSMTSSSTISSTFAAMPASSSGADILQSINHIS